MTEVSATLQSVLAGHAMRQPAAPLALAPETGSVLTYRALADQTDRLSAFLHYRGIERGATIALHLHNGTQTAALFLGLMCAGYVVAPLNLLSQRSQLAAVIAHSGARLVFSCAAHRAQLAEAISELHHPPDTHEIDIDALRLFEEFEPSRHAPVHRVTTGDTALLMYTSGTTGMPKGVLLSHANLLSAARAVATWHSLTANDRVLSSLPLYHINGQVIATLAPFLSGGSIVAPHRFSATQWWDLVEQFRCTWINMVPTIIAYLLNTPETRKFPGLRFGRSASAPLPPEQHKAFEARFGVPVIEAMGMTECASTVFCNPHDDRRRYGSPGLPCGVEAGVLDEAGRHLRAHETGELVLRGPNVMTGYFKAPDLTAKAIDADGWLRTGDLGFRDADGFYFVTGRLKELIIKGGENIAPREIDEVLLRHPAILEAAAFAIADANYGQEIAAAVILKPNAVFDPAEISAFCVRELGKYKTPSRWHVVTDLPKGPSGKVQRLKLPDILGA